MRNIQIKLRFDEQSELRRIWAQMPVAARAEIARRYARVLVKAAKADSVGRKKHKEERS